MKRNKINMKRGIFYSVLWISSILLLAPSVHEGPTNFNSIPRVEKFSYNGHSYMLMSNTYMKGATKTYLHDPDCNNKKCVCK